MKPAVIFLSAFLCLNTAPSFASPLIDVLTGSAFLLAGGAFEIKRSDAKEKREESENAAAIQSSFAANNLIKYIDAFGNAQYFYGAADLEEFQNGKTAIFSALVSEGISWDLQADSYLRQGSSYANQASAFFDDADNHRDDENLYKGVSLTSFAAGGFFLVKGAWGYLRSPAISPVAQIKQPHWTKNFHVAPTARYDGIQLAWVKKW